MRVAVISEIRPGSPRAHAINVVKTAGGFARLGHETLVLCRAPGPDAPDAGALYAEPSLAWRFAPEHAGWGASRAFAEWCAAEAGAFGAEVVYARHFEGALACAGAGFSTVLETHAYVGDESPLLRRACEATSRSERPLRAITTISPRLAAYYRSIGADADRLHIVPDGVDLGLFLPPARLDDPPFARAAREQHAVYAGHLYDYKGIPTILGAAALLPRVVFHLVGGLPEDIERTRAAAAALGNVRLHGPCPHAAVPRWLWHADCLLLPPSGEHPSAAWTSPVKLGEYLAAGPPVVASAIPGLRDWVDAPAVRWFRPDDAKDLAVAIETSLGETAEHAALRRGHARALAERFAYSARAGAMLAAAGHASAREAGGLQR